MEIRHAVNPTDFKTYTTDRLREEFLIPVLFIEDEIKLVYSHDHRNAIFLCGDQLGIILPYCARVDNKIAVRRKVLLTMKLWVEEAQLDKICYM